MPRGQGRRTGRKPGAVKICLQKGHALTQTRARRIPALVKKGREYFWRTGFPVGVEVFNGETGDVIIDTRCDESCSPPEIPEDEKKNPKRRGKALMKMQTGRNLSATKKKRWIGLKKHALVTAARTGFDVTIVKYTPEGEPTETAEFKSASPEETVTDY